jgi:hypothetical protein
VSEHRQELPGWVRLSCEHHLCCNWVTTFGLILKPILPHEDFSVQVGEF